MASAVDGRGSRVWAFLSAAGARHYCPQCQQPVVVRVAPAGHLFFAHEETKQETKRHQLLNQPPCGRFSGVPDLNTEAKHMLLAALNKTNVCRAPLVVRRKCDRCGCYSQRSIQFDRAVDPLGAGAQLPPDYADTGADILLLGADWSIAGSVGFGLRAASNPQVIHCSAPSAISSALAALSTNSAVCLEEARNIPAASGCERKECIPLKELAQILGWRRSWTSDDVDWESDAPDVSQFIANACTGRIRVYITWQSSPQPLVSGLALRLWQAELFRRKKCPYCEQKFPNELKEPDEQKFSEQWPFCAACSPQIYNRSRMVLPYDEVKMDPAARSKRLAQVGWVRAFPYVKKPEKPQTDDEAASFVPTNDKPCVGCNEITYKPLFFYGYRAICPPCLSQQFQKQNENNKEKR